MGLDTQWFIDHCQVGDAKNLFILQGFTAEEVATLPREANLFSKYTYNDVFDLVDTLGVVASDPSFLMNITALLQNTELDFVWVTIDEYLAFANPSIFNFFNMTVVNNNLYDKFYPLTLPLPGIADIYKYGYFEDNPLTDEQTKVLNKITNVYGQIYFNEVNGQYYITYSNYIEEKNTVDYYPTAELILEDKLNSTSAIISVFANEDSLLDLPNQLLNNKAPQISLGLSEDLDLSRFGKRLSAIIMQFAADKTVKLSVVEQTHSVIKNEQDYLDVLHKYWGYDEFRQLRMYKNPKKNNEVVDVSQIQIIDDIIKQAEVGISGKQPRDIFITASTGAGKSVMFQLPAFYLSEQHTDIKPLTIVIQPLIGLMNDQVQSLKRRGIESVATINSNIDALKKNEIIERIHNGEINILFISTETLQNRTDITQLIGDRKIGLFIVDEAHTVTTWGKTFRADYWYMGMYITKLRKDYKFPIVTFTATAIFGGRLDMYSETVDSLNLIEPIKYIGYVKRDDIELVINHKEDFDSKKTMNDYLMVKIQDIITKLEVFVAHGQKTLVYFPTVKDLNSVFSSIEKETPALAKTIRRYTGKLNPAEKEIAFKDFESGAAKVIFATKAFGMGIDIADIKNVYHFAPTGDVVDYIQEIGRSARKEDIRGDTILLYLKNDLNAIKMLHGMSAIRRDQILRVMGKIVDMANANRNSNNLVVSADDFKYVLQLDENDDLDNKIKIILLMIEKDFENRIHGYPPFNARPKPVFGKELIFLRGDRGADEAALLQSHYGKYLERTFYLKGDIYIGSYEFNVEKIWENEYKLQKNISYPNFKREMYSERDKLDADFRGFLDKYVVLATSIDISVKATVEETKSAYEQIFQHYKEFLRERRGLQKMFTLEDLASYIGRKQGNNRRSEALGIANALINGSIEISKQRNKPFLKVRTGLQNGLYDVNTNYSELIDEFENSVNKLFSGNMVVEWEGKYHKFYKRILQDKKNTESILNTDLAVLGIGEALLELTYELKNGNNPQISLRLNGMFFLKNALANPDKYENRLLSKVQEKHRLNVQFLEYLFTHKAVGDTAKERVNNYTEWFWQEIEKFFLGKIPQRVLDAAFEKREE